MLAAVKNYFVIFHHIGYVQVSQDCIDDRIFLMYNKEKILPEEGDEDKRRSDSWNKMEKLKMIGGLQVEPCGK